MPTATRTRKASIMWVLLPLVAVLGVVGYVGLDLYKEQQDKTRDEEEARKNTLGRPNSEDRKTRELKPESLVEPAEPEVVPEDDLPTLPKGVKAPRVVTKEVRQVPSQRAYTLVKAKYEKLVNENSQKKFKGKMQVLDSQIRSVGPDDAAFIARCDSLREEIDLALANPENR